MQTCGEKTIPRLMLQWASIAVSLSILSSSSYKTRLVTLDLIRLVLIFVTVVASGCKLLLLACRDLRLYAYLCQWENITNSENETFGIKQTKTKAGMLTRPACRSRMGSMVASC